MHEPVILTLENGQEVNLLLNFQKLGLLKKINNSLYQKFNAFLSNTKKELDILEVPLALYVAYWCANYNVDNARNILSKEEFIDLTPFDMTELKRTFELLTRPKKKKVLGKTLEEKQAS